MARKAFAETWKQVRPLEEDLTAYRAVFIALGMFFTTGVRSRWLYGFEGCA